MPRQSRSSLKQFFSVLLTGHEVSESETYESVDQPSSEIADSINHEANNEITIASSPITEFKWEDSISPTEDTILSMKPVEITHYEAWSPEPEVSLRGENMIDGEPGITTSETRGEVQHLETVPPPAIVSQEHETMPDWLTDNSSLGWEIDTGEGDIRERGTESVIEISQTKKSDGFTSLRDVLKERGNFWQEAKEGKINPSTDTLRDRDTEEDLSIVDEDEALVLVDDDISSENNDQEEVTRQETVTKKTRKKKSTKKAPETHIVDPVHEETGESEEVLTGIDQSALSPSDTPEILAWEIHEAEVLSTDFSSKNESVADSTPESEDAPAPLEWIGSETEMRDIVPHISGDEIMIGASTETPETRQPPLLLGISRDGHESIRIDSDALARHMLVIGRTGSGKSTLLERMILQDIDAGRGVGLIDPHGDLYERIARQIPRSRSNEVVLFDLADSEYPIGFNILENTSDQLPSLIASSIVGVFKKIFGYSWGPRLEYILRNATLTLIEKPGSTLLDLTMLLTDEDFRQQYLRNISNPFLQKFWANEFGTLSQSRQAEVTSPILNKVGQFLSVPLVRNIISQPQSGFSPRWMMDREKIFLANLSKGKIGEDVSEMIGSLLVSKFQLDVMSRASMSPADRRPFRLYVDEFQNFATESFADILSESRKYGLELVIAHQYLGQVDKKLIESILGNVGSMTVFHTSYDDAKILAPNLSKNLSYEDLTEQHNFEFTMKTIEKNKKTFKRGELLPPDMIPLRPHLQDYEKIQKLVREKYAKERSFVEGKLSDKVKGG